MSEDKKADATVCCASCGIAEIDDIKLMNCDGCDLVRYCSDECREDHEPQHEEECKKRAVELRDELLFKQPEGTHMGDCPICMIPLPIAKSLTYECCSKIACYGCYYANSIREVEMRRQHSCPFCREASALTDEVKIGKRKLKRIEANDPAAMCQKGIEQFQKGDYRSAYGYLAKSAEFGYTDAHYKLAHLYRNGQGVEKDEGKEIHHLEEAAIGGHPDARFMLGGYEINDDNDERALKHWIIAANQGHDASTKALMAAFKDGLISKEDLASALRAHKAAVDATESPQRKAAEILLPK